MKEKFRWLLLVAALYMIGSNMYETGIRLANSLILLMVLACFGVQIYFKIKRQKEEAQRLLDEEAERRAKRRAKRAGGAKKAAIRERQEEKKQERRERRKALREKAAEAADKPETADKPEQETTESADKKE